MNGSICPGWEVFLKARLVATSYIRKCQNGRAFESHIKSSVLEISASLVFEAKCGIELFSALLDSMSSSYVLDNFYFLGLSTERVFWQIKNPSSVLLFVQRLIKKINFIKSTAMLTQNCNNFH